MSNINIWIGIMIPFIGTSLGAMLVLFMKNDISPKLEKALTGFAAGVMVAASIWSLIIPSMEHSEKMGRLSFIPAFVGFWIGILFLLFLDSVVPHIHMDSDESEGIKANFKKTTMLVLAVTLHNIPEGMAVGVVYAGWMNGHKSISLASALVLAVGIAIQNFPEGAIVSMPLKGEGFSRKKSFGYGVLSGAVEPIASILTIIAAGFIIPALPYFLSFAAGAMMYVVVEELIPEMSSGHHSNLATILFAVGFTGMMVLDVALG